MTINRCAWKAPSNIAIVKYWGKHGRQLPMNPSISFTLNSCTTAMQLEWIKGSGNVFLSFAGKKSEKFEKKIHDFLHSVVDIFPFIPEYDFYLNSENSFPHSAGIASSASSMAALSLNLCTMASTLGLMPETNTSEFFEKANYIARLASGSACRSLYGKAVLWGELAAEEGRDTHAKPLCGVHPVFNDFRDTILIVDDQEKSVSSRVGHSLMNGHSFAHGRFEQAKHNTARLLTALREGDLQLFGEIAEEEALTLHAMMMTSHPSFILMRANSLRIIELVRHYRQQSEVPVYFTLDAGPNIHLLYPAQYSADIKLFVENNLAPLCVQQPIYDQVGNGPERLL